MKHIFRKSIFHEPYCYVLYLLISLKNIHPNIQDIYIYLLILLKIFIYPPKISILIMKFLYISNSYLFSRSEVIRSRDIIHKSSLFLMLYSKHYQRRENFSPITSVIGILTKSELFELSSFTSSIIIPD